MQEVLRELFERLEKVGDVHAEVYDTDVREEMRDAVTDGFLAPVEGFAVPDDYAMYTAQGNALVKEVFEWFLPLANERAQALGLDSFHKRLDRFQESEVETERELLSKVVG